MGYKQRKFGIIKKFLSTDLIFDIRKLLRNRGENSKEILELESKFGQK